MEILVLSFAITIAVLALVLYLELKNTQERLESVRRDIEKRVSEKIETVLHDTSERLPEIEKRVAEIAERIAYQQQDQAIRESVSDALAENLSKQPSSSAAIAGGSVGEQPASDRPPLPG